MITTIQAKNWKVGDIIYSTHAMMRRGTVAEIIPLGRNHLMVRVKGGRHRDNGLPRGWRCVTRSSLLCILRK